VRSGHGKGSSDAGAVGFGERGWSARLARPDVRKPVSASVRERQGGRWRARCESVRMVARTCGKVLVRVGEPTGCKAPGDTLRARMGAYLHRRSVVHRRGKPWPKPFPGTTGRCSGFIPLFQGQFAFSIRKWGGEKKVQPGVYLGRDTVLLTAGDWTGSRTSRCKRYVDPMNNIVPHPDAKLLVFLRRAATVCSIARTSAIA